MSKIYGTGQRGEKRMSISKASAVPISWYGIEIKLKWTQLFFLKSSKLKFCFDADFTDDFFFADLYTDISSVESVLFCVKFAPKQIP